VRHPIKEAAAGADRLSVDDTTIGTRRAADRDRASAPRPNAVRRLFATVRDGLYRPLAGDDARVAYWVRHVRHGILLSEVAALWVVGYVLITHTPGRHSAVLLTLTGLVMVGCPFLLLLPLREMMRDSRGPTMFYVWTLATSALVIIGTRIDGGPSSPLDALLFLTLTYMAVAYSPYGVVAMGGTMTVAYLVFVELPGVSTSGLFFIAVMVSFTMICAMASANSWAAYDRQVTLIRTQETLAATDPLTGIPNRRAYLERVAAAVGSAAWGHQAVVCLVDLDGFKAVNDAGGHAAGDYMLRSVATALGGAVRETDTVARLGGDEFVLVIKAPGDELHRFESAFIATVDKVRESVAVPLTLGQHSVRPTCRVGICLYPQDADSPDLLLRHADAAMYDAKVRRKTARAA